MDEEEEEDDFEEKEIKKAFGDVAERLDDDTRLEALRGVERKMMMKVVNDGKCIENVERHLERRLKEDDFDDDFDDEFNHHHHPRKGGGEKKKKQQKREDIRDRRGHGETTTETRAHRGRGVRTDGRAPNENVFVGSKSSKLPRTHSLRARRVRENRRRRKIETRPSIIIIEQQQQQQQQKQ